MGNHVSNGSTRVILPDGTVTKYNEPVTVGELMLDHPQQAVVEFQPVAKKQKPLVADFRLENNKVYLMVPMRRGPVADITLDMTMEERRRFILKSGLFLSAYTGIIPLFVKMWPKTVIKSYNKTKITKKPPAVMMKPELFREVESVLEGRGGHYVKKSWKPSLDTIKEKGVKAKTRRWLPLRESL
ncbi:uncharacterized protein LOC143601716 [Bidens hawaiensis]|uniref:uncharacterized protein LOC143601716 n=1 Tax=Bidens hawaiensis TaxID=980011 RepID=UPI004049737B